MRHSHVAAHDVLLIDMVPSAEHTLINCDDDIEGAQLVLELDPFSNALLAWHHDLLLQACLVGRHCKQWAREVD
jgi:hypothetical protein